MHSWKEKKNRIRSLKNPRIKIDREGMNDFAGKICKKRFEKRVLRFSFRETIISPKIPAWIGFKLARSSKIFTDGHGGRIHEQTSELEKKEKERERESFFWNDSSREGWFHRSSRAMKLRFPHRGGEISNFSPFPDNSPSASRILSSVPSDSSP